MPASLLFRAPTTRACPQCGVLRLLKDYRRWRGGQRVLHALCNTCDPEKRFSEMTPTQRMRAVDADRPGARLLVIENMNDAEQMARRHATSRERLAYHAKERRKAWREAIGKRVADEHAWALRALSVAERMAGVVDGYSPVMPNSRLAAPHAGAWAAWVEFFRSYAQVLRLMRERIDVLAKKKYAPVKPTPEQCDPCYYADASTRASLRRLYSACRPIPNRRMYRDPWCLSWGQE